MLKKAFRVLAAAGAMWLAGSVAANASPTYNTGSLVLLATTDDTTNLATDTTFTASPLLDIFPGVFVQNRTGSFVGQPGPSGPMMPLYTPAAFDFGNAASFDFNQAGTYGTFTATSIVFLGTQTNGKSLTKSWEVIGTFTLGADWANAGHTITAAETWGFTQTGGAGNGISVSATFNAPLSVPEPLTISLFGAGLAGASWFARRRRKADRGTA